jgi:hypothetical protein
LSRHSESGLKFVATFDPDSADLGSGRFAAKLDLAMF